MKVAKQRFSVWFNKSHGRFGTLWAERFKSVLVEGKGNALLTMAAYIDLNPVRAGLVEDPKDYRFCGYAESVAGAGPARAGLHRIAETGSEKQALASYRMTLFGKGGAVDPQKGDRAARIDREKALAVIENGGRLSRSELLRCRIRYFTDGAVLGSRLFVQAAFEQNRDKVGAKRSIGPKPMRGGDWGDLCILRGLRKQVFS